MKRVAAVTALCLLAAAGSGRATPPLRIRTSADLAPCLERVLGSVAKDAFTVEIGDPTSTDDADIVIGHAGLLTRTLESGRADDRLALEIARGPLRRPSRAVVAAPVGSSEHFEAAYRLIERLAAREAQQALADCTGGPALRDAAAEAAPFVPGMARYATGIADWWEPACSLRTNLLVDPNAALGPPDAVNLAPRGSPSNYRGMISLGQGGWIVVDMGQSITNRAGDEVRIHQFTSVEPVSLYAGDSPTGPFTLVAFRRDCGNRMPGAPANWGYCDFDLAEGGVGSARYLKIEDGELYACLKADTRDEGADIDAVELLNQ
jgi:hypothetical protein